jgi:hypothetical protein
VYDEVLILVFPGTKALVWFPVPYDPILNTRGITSHFEATFIAITGQGATIAVVTLLAISLLIADPS